MVADTLSRLPCKSTEFENEIMNDRGRYTYLHYVVQSKIACLDYKAVARKTAKDKTLSIIKRMVIRGWPERKSKDWPDELKPYASRRDEITLEKECLMWGQRVIVPLKLQTEVLNKIHESHFGIVRMNSLARSVVWWPGIDDQLEKKQNVASTVA